MKDILAKVLSILRQSTWFKKLNSVLGGFALGVWFAGNHWQQIRDVRLALGISSGEWNTALLGIAGACGIGLSVYLSAAMTPDDKQAVADKAVGAAQANAGAVNGPAAG